MAHASLSVPCAVWTIRRDFGNHSAHFEGCCQATLLLLCYRTQKPKKVSKPTRPSNPPDPFAAFVSSPLFPRVTCPSGIVSCVRWQPEGLSAPQRKTDSHGLRVAVKQPARFFRTARKPLKTRGFPPRKAIPHCVEIPYLEAHLATMSLGVAIVSRVSEFPERGARVARVSFVIKAV